MDESFICLNDIKGGTLADDFPTLQPEARIAVAQNLLRGMRDQHHGGAAFFDQLFHAFGGFASKICIPGAQNFVHYQDIRLEGSCCGENQTCLHTC